jgi:hypothetical protein
MICQYNLITYGSIVFTQNLRGFSTFPWVQKYSLKSQLSQEIRSFHALLLWHPSFPCYKSAQHYTEHTTITLKNTIQNGEWNSYNPELSNCSEISENLTREKGVSANFLALGPKFDEGLEVLGLWISTTSRFFPALVCWFPYNRHFFVYFTTDFTALTIYITYIFYERKTRPVTTKTNNSIYISLRDLPCHLWRAEVTTWPNWVTTRIGTKFKVVTCNGKRRICYSAVREYLNATPTLLYQVQGAVFMEVIKIYT